jgi:replicative DNA helicase
MRADLARLKAQHNIQWFVVDYLYLLQDRYGGDDHERLAYISKALKAICKDLDLSGLIIHSMTKSEMESNNPSLAGMRGSGQIGYDADVAIYLLEDELNKQTGVKLYFVKFREDTPDRFVRLERDNGFPAFKSITKGEPATYRTPYKD